MQQGNVLKSGAGWAVEVYKSDTRIPGIRTKGASPRLRSENAERPVTQSTGGLLSRTAAWPAWLWSVTAGRMKTRAAGNGTSVPVLYPSANARGRHDILAKLSLYALVSP